MRARQLALEKAERKKSQLAELRSKNRTLGDVVTTKSEQRRKAEAKTQKDIKDHRMSTGYLHRSETDEGHQVLYADKDQIQQKKDVHKRRKSARAKSLRLKSANIIMAREDTGWEGDADEVVLAPEELAQASS
eukprot:GFYU01022988.1.p2 GENE.GFYU01022988.1~~GFYU01022988.1.p2  ORF type:complete len:151 (+),score=48.65 GFYU01022988.1:55-453(+)